MCFLFSINASLLKVNDSIISFLILIVAQLESLFCTFKAIFTKATICLSYRSSVYAIFFRFLRDFFPLKCSFFAGYLVSCTPCLHGSLYTEPESNVQNLYATFIAYRYTSQVRSEFMKAEKKNKQKTLPIDHQ